MQINLETSEVDEISEIHTKLLRVSILHSLCYSQRVVSKERAKYLITQGFFSMKNSSEFSKGFPDSQRSLKCLS